MSVHVPSPLPLPSGLASLVEVEARLDAQLADAGATAAAIREAARQRAEVAAATLDAEIARESDRLSAEIAAAADAQVSAAETAARAEIARFDAVAGAVVDELAQQIAVGLAAFALEEAAS